MPFIDLWSILLLYAAVQGVALTVYVLLNRLRRAGYVLAALLLICSGMIACFVFYYSNYHKLYPDFIWMDPVLYYLPGAAFYFFVLHYLFPQRGWRWYDVLHLGPALWMLWRMIPFYQRAPEEKLQRFLQYYADPNFTYDWYQASMFILIMVYAGWSLFLYRRHRSQEAAAHASSKQLDTRFIGVTAILFLLWAGITQVYNFMLAWDFPYFITFDFVGLLSLTAFIHYMGFEGFRRKDHWLSMPAVSKESPTAGVLSPEECSALAQRAGEYMMEQELYRRPELKIQELAAALDVPVHHLSQALNQGAGHNFFDFVNGYRVDFVKERLLAGDLEQVTLAAIAERAGFNSQTSFYRIFKKHTGMTPRNFLRAQEVGV